MGTPSTPNNPGQPNENDSGDSDVAVEEGRPKLNEATKYAVVIHNDDYTTFDFVVEVLQKFFHKSSQEAADITLQVHHQGRGVAGIFSRQIAETKAAQVIEYSRAHGHPLRASVEPA